MINTLITKKKKKNNNNNQPKRYKSFQNVLIQSLNVILAFGSLCNIPAQAKCFRLRIPILDLEAATGTRRGTARLFVGLVRS